MVPSSLLLALRASTFRLHYYTSRSAPSALHLHILTFGPGVWPLRWVPFSLWESSQVYMPVNLAWRIDMLKRFTKVLTIWGGIDCAICTFLLIYSAAKAIQIDRENHKWVKECFTNSPAPDPFLQDIPEVQIPSPLGKAFTSEVLWCFWLYYWLSYVWS